MFTNHQNSSVLSSMTQQTLTVVHVVEGCQGGVGSAVRHLIDAQHQDPGIADVHLFADPGRMGDMLYGVPARLHEYKSSRSAFQLLSVCRDLQRRLRAIAPDVVYLHSTFPGLYGRLWPRSDAAPWATMYCAHGWAFTQQLPLPQKKVYALAERALGSRTDAIISISYSEFDAAVKAGISSPLHRVIYHGVPDRKTPAAPPVQVDPRSLNLAFIGRFDRQKGLDVLLQAFADPQLSGVNLWLIGGSTLGHECSIPQQPNIKLIGWVPNDQIDDYIQCFDAVVVPSRWEGFGLIALEAMRNAKPVLASRTGGLAELLIDGVNGRLFNPEDVSDLTRVLRALSKPELQRMGKAALEIFDTGFQLGACYLRWRALTQDALALRGLRHANTEASYLEPATALTAEES